MKTERKGFVVVKKGATANLALFLIIYKEHVLHTRFAFFRSKV